MPTTLYELSGEQVLRDIVRRFYSLIETDRAYADLRAMHHADLGPLRESLALFLIAWSGGPRGWFAARPNGCIMGLHRAMPITPTLARQWADAMARSIADSAIDREIGRQMAGALARMAQAMISIPDASPGPVAGAA